MSGSENYGLYANLAHRMFLEEKGKFIVVVVVVLEHSLAHLFIYYDYLCSTI